MLLECILLQDFSSGNKCCQLAGSENFDFKFTFKFLFALSKEPGSCALLAIKIWLPRLHGFFTPPKDKAQAHCPIPLAETSAA